MCSIYIDRVFRYSCPTGLRRAVAAGLLSQCLELWTKIGAAETELERPATSARGPPCPVEECLEFYNFPAGARNVRCTMLNVSCPTHEPRRNAPNLSLSLQAFAPILVTRVLGAQHSGRFLPVSAGSSH